MVAICEMFRGYRNTSQRCVLPAAHQRFGNAFASITASSVIPDGRTDEAAQNARKAAKVTIFQSCAITIAFFTGLWVSACALGDALAFIANLLDRFDEEPSAEPPGAPSYPAP